MAQLVEQLIRNQQVAGSNPASSSKSQRTDKSLSSGFLSCLSVARNGAVRTLTRKRQVLPGAPYGVWQYAAKTQPFCTLKTNRVTDISLPLGFLSCLSVARNGSVRTLTRKRQVLPKAFRSRKGAVFGRKNKEPCKIAHILQGFFIAFPLIRQCFQKLENDLSLIFRDLRKQLEQRVCSVSRLPPSTPL